MEFLDGWRKGHRILWMINSFLRYVKDCRKPGNYKINRRVFFTYSGAIAIWVMNQRLTDHFSVDEMKCKGTGICMMDDHFMDLLEKIRIDFGKPMRITSGFRHPDYNLELQKKGTTKTGADGPHTTGRACDVWVYGEDFQNLMVIAKHHGMTGFGISQKGDYKSRFLHLDNLPNIEGKQPRPWTWSY